jgi:hypothetical protein
MGGLGSRYKSRPAVMTRGSGDDDVPWASHDEGAGFRWPEVGFYSMNHRRYLPDMSPRAKR